MSECSLTEFCEKHDVVDDKCLTYKAYQQGKADAIDECIRALAKMPDCKNSLLIRLKQLKEEQNESQV